MSGPHLFQTETSATLHCRREARRLGDTPPSRVMLAVAEHADLVLDELPGLAQRNGLPVSRGGVAAGSLFSALRERLTIRLPLVTRAEEQLGWFAAHSDRAVLPARPIPLLGLLRHV